MERLAELRWRLCFRDLTKQEVAQSWRYPEYCLLRLCSRFATGMQFGQRGQRSKDLPRQNKRTPALLWRDCPAEGYT